MANHAPCPSCTKTQHFDGCAHVDCPRRKPWGAGDVSDITQIFTPSRFREGKRTKDPIVEIGSEGCFRKVKHKGQP